MLGCFFCISCLFTSELVSGADCSSKQEERETRKGGKVAMKQKNLHGCHEHLSRFLGYLNVSLEVYGMALSVTGF